jgi:hypothetical protein
MFPQKIFKTVLLYYNKQKNIPKTWDKFNQGKNFINKASLQFQIGISETEKV